MKLTHFGLLSALVTLFSACHSSQEPVHPPAPSTPATKVTVPSPLHLNQSAYDTAGEVTLPAKDATECKGLHHVYLLSDRVISGSEPVGIAGLQSIADMGVRTVISVDGSAPDHETAARLGLRYVHVPIQYRAITDEEILKLSKTFREAEGPIYVHCYHGKHRGPAAAAIGRLVIDGVPREVAIAEMRQYGGTASSYEGLYATIAASKLPTPEETAAFEYGFDPVHQPKGVVGAMAVLARAFDNVTDASKREWVADEEHPDLNALNEAQKLQQAFELAWELDSTQSAPADQRAWFDQSRTESAKLVEALRRFEKGEVAASAEAKQSLKAVKALCSQCHEAYRN